MRPVPLELDPELPVIEAIQQGDAHALAELMERHGSWVRGVIFGVLGRADEVDDVAQKVWMQVWREARRLEDPARWRPWLYRIARHAATDAARHRRRRRRLLQRFVHRRPSPTAQVPGTSRPSRGAQVPGTSPLGADAPLLADEHRRLVQQAIAGLPALYREPFVLRHLEDWSYARIAETLGLPVDTVETRLVRARRLLRAALAGKL